MEVRTETGNSGTGTASSAVTSPSSASHSNGTLGAWQARALHAITLPSGQRVRIRIPGLGTMLERGDLPDELLELAYMELTAEGGATAELALEITRAREAGKHEEARTAVARYAAFQRELVCAAIAEVDRGDGEFVPVELSPADLDGDALPEDDLAMVAEIAQRLRAHDARGVRIGVEPIDRWAAFRSAHGCPDQDCPGCAALVRELSTAHVGDV